jgi:hypothetical protein
LVEEEKRFTQAQIDALHEKMHGGDNEDFFYSVSRSFVSQMKQPLLVFMGSDRAHPSETSREIVQLAKDATLIEK